MRERKTANAADSIDSIERNRQKKSRRWNFNTRINNKNGQKTPEMPVLNLCSYATQILSAA